MSREKVIQKIKKLLALATNNDSPNEAAVAAASARKMMDKYQIGRLEVEQFDTSEFGRSEHQLDTGKLPFWKSILGLEVAHYNDTIITLKRSRYENKMSVVFSGYEVDAILATAMYAYLIEAIEKHTERARKDGLISGRTEINSFRMGAAKELVKRLKKLRLEREAQQVGPTGTGLMVVKRQQVTAKFGEQKTKSRSYNTHHSAENHGRVAGSKIGLDPQVQGSQAARLN